MFEKFVAFRKIKNNSEYRKNIAEVLELPSELLEQAARYVGLSQSQLKQDLFAFSKSGFKKGGYFVEFGATNGKSLSNSYLLEKEFSWQGIVAEPAKNWHEALRENRNCNIETDCVWIKTGKMLDFVEADSGELSTLEAYKDQDHFAKKRNNSQGYQVKTISLIDLLNKYDAPDVIDYLSIDTEGSEFDILNAFDFEKYRINVITCEHNYTENRQKIYQLLTSKGYERVYTGFSQWDDWYVLSDNN